MGRDSTAARIGADALGAVSAWRARTGVGRFKREGRVRTRMRTELHRGPIEDLRSVWDEVFAADSQATPFSSPEWGLAWCHHFALPDSEPWFLLAFDGSEVVGLAPLVIRRRGPFRIVRPVGEEPSDYWDVVAVPELRGAVVSTLGEDLVRRGRSWDLLALGRIPAQSPMSTIVGEANLRTQWSERTPCPGIPLPATFDDYLAGLPQQRRTNFRRRLRHLDEGEIQLRDITQVGELPAAVDRWHAVRTKEWAQAGRELAPMHRSQRFQTFMREVMQLLVPKRLALMWEFWRDDELVGSYVSFVDSRCFYHYLGGFDAKAAQLGVGKIAICHGIRTSIAAGRSYYDFMIGNEPYKYEYGAIDQHATSFLLGNHHPRSRLAAGARQLRSG